MNICFTGSRSLTGVYDFVLKAVLRCKELGAQVIVGDAGGIDNLVSMCCAENDVPCIVHHIATQPRHAHSGNELCKVSGGYLARDRYMVERADIVFALWDGQSRGTKYTYDHAVKLGKEAHIKRM
ncbi:MAG: hypothetical protein KAJ19_06525 [Gammaproteobacteria bacterium]|nr:hypothetical protein [Gammaproteobacteria bacterium]